EGLTRIYYVDVDAHHGDGVQDAFAEDERVFTLSIHEAGRWPYTGRVEDRAGGSARNLPGPPGFHDSEMAFLLEEGVLPNGARLRPEANVLQWRADGLADDPMSGLGLSNRALWGVVQALRDLAPPGFLSSAVEAITPGRWRGVGRAYGRRSTASTQARRRRRLPRPSSAASAGTGGRAAIPRCAGS